MLREIPEDRPYAYSHCRAGFAPSCSESWGLWPPADAPALTVNAATNTTVALLPIWGADLFLHSGIALAAFYFGFVHRSVDVHRHHATPHRA